MKKHYHLGPPPGLVSEPFPLSIAIAIIFAWLGSGIFGAFFSGILIGQIAGYILLGQFVWGVGYAWFDNERTKKFVREQNEAFKKFKESNCE